MGDPHARKSAAVSRLRHQLRKKRESLADHFEFKMYIIFHFKEKKKKVAIFEVAEVVPVMTNNYEDSILKGVKEEAYSYESSRELLDKDVVQLHAPRWQSMRRDVIGCTTEIDFFLWPRSDIDRIECQLFSRWKGDQLPFKRIEASFLFSHLDYERQLMRLVSRRDKEGLIINNPSQTMFLFIDKQQLQTAKNKIVVFKLSSVCLYLPQDQLTHWGAGNVEELVATYL
ncbi:uncharacterized protein C6orf62 homolog [Haliotis rubra]|uniref:uncharacterized protein C6orf62 homolog n=1 Tax=Haliotis rufescens TaxID=6454 RepID=UPI001EB07E1D|nr:uncharacterized protein C6orf62 homolog [Haliotis rufescens]XP_046585645.1 uncharacterized protein C6orf62 homolog [Haliotis rubra]